MRQTEPNEHTQHSIDILIVDPMVSDARKTSAALRRARPDISIARVMQGDQALRLMLNRGLLTVAPQLPRLILLELGQHVDGKTLLKQLQMNERTFDIPAIVFSASRECALIAECYSLGAAGYFAKPHDPDKYAATLAGIASFWLDQAEQLPMHSYRAAPQLAAAHPLR